MAFKMTPGIKGNPANSSMMNGGCGGDGQPPCPPRFQAEKTMAPVAERSSRSKAIRAKTKVKAPAPAPLPVKLEVNLPDGFKMNELVAGHYKRLFGDLSGYKNQKVLDTAVAEFVKKFGSPLAGPIDGPIIGFPGEGPIKLPPVKFDPVKGIGEGEFKAPVLKAPVKKAAAVKAK